jgi:predicted AAA+ superfamily ATPase
LVKGSSEYGKLFEQFIVSECFRLNDYFEKDFKFYYLRTKDGAEIDLIVKLNPKDKILIEIKSTNKITDADFRHLRGLSADIKHIEKWVLCDEKSPRKTDDGIRVLPWRLGLSELFGLKSK